MNGTHFPDDDGDFLRRQMNRERSTPPASYWSDLTGDPTQADPAQPPETSLEQVSGEASGLARQHDPRDGNGDEDNAGTTVTPDRSLYTSQASGGLPLPATLPTLETPPLHRVQKWRTRTFLGSPSPAKPAPESPTASMEPLPSIETAEQPLGGPGGRVEEPVEQNFRASSSSVTPVRRFKWEEVPPRKKRGDSVELRATLGRVLEKIGSKLNFRDIAGEAAEHHSEIPLNPSSDVDIQYADPKLTYRDPLAPTQAKNPSPTPEQKQPDETDPEPQASAASPIGQAPRTRSQKKLLSSPQARQAPGSSGNHRRRREKVSSDRAEPFTGEEPLKRDKSPTRGPRTRAQTKLLSSAQTAEEPSENHDRRRKERAEADKEDSLNSGPHKRAKTNRSRESVTGRLTTPSISDVSESRMFG